MGTYGYFKADTEISEDQLPESFQLQLRQLRIINFTQAMEQHWPSRAFLVGCAVTITCLVVGMFLFEYLGKAGFEFFVDSKQKLLIPIFSIAVGSAVTAIAAKLMKGYAEILDERLASYEPVDENAYKELQESFHRCGELYAFQVRDWIQKERRAIANAAGMRYFSKSKFANKIVKDGSNENRQ